MNIEIRPQAKSRKHKRRKIENRIVEGEDEEIRVVTFEEREIATPAGFATERVEVPVRVPIGSAQSAPDERAQAPPIASLEDLFGAEYDQNDDNIPKSQETNKVMPMPSMIYKYV
jgi:hypothetical protein